MESNMFVLDEFGIVFELDSKGHHNFICIEKNYDKGPELTNRKIVVKSSLTTAGIYNIYVQTHEKLYEHVGCVWSGEPEILSTKGDRQRLKIEEGSLLHEALKETLRPPLTLAEEICKATNDSE